MENHLTLSVPIIMTIVFVLYFPHDAIQWRHFNSFIVNWQTSCELFFILSGFADIMHACTRDESISFFPLFFWSPVLAKRGGYQFRSARPSVSHSVYHTFVSRLYLSKSLSFCNDISYNTSLWIEKKYLYWFWGQKLNDQGT